MTPSPARPRHRARRALLAHQFGPHQRLRPLAAPGVVGDAAGLRQPHRCVVVLRQPSDIKAQFGNASILKSRRVVFNIKGNDYRLVAALAYNTGIVFVKFMGTHQQYDDIDADTVELE